LIASPSGAGLFSSSWLLTFWKPALRAFNLLLLLCDGYSGILLFNCVMVASCSSKRTVKFRNKSYDQPAQEGDGRFRCNSQTTRNTNPKGERPD
jgi:hypothetical protein